MRRAQTPFLIPLVRPVAMDGSTVRGTPPVLHPSDEILTPSNAAYLDALAGASEAGGVDPHWAPILRRLADPTLPPTAAVVEGTLERPRGRSVDPLVSEMDRRLNMRLAWMVRAYEWHGHVLANLDPLKLYSPEGHYNPIGRDEFGKLLAYQSFGFADHDLDREYYINFGANVGAIFTSGAQPMTLREIIKHLKQVYCGTVGAEFMHSGYAELRPWMRKQLLQRVTQPRSKEDRLQVFSDTIAACGFEALLSVKYASKKRFGLEGGEALIPGMKALLDELAEGGATSCIIGMAHRGRLNVLANVCGKALEVIFNEFEDKVKGTLEGSGDVKYHLGSERQIQTIRNKPMNITLMPNPSHLEAVDPLVAGRCLARQTLVKGASAKTTVPIVIHGDASVSGQGVVYETLAMSEIENFGVGGTIHIVINNQVGFTTDSSDQRSTTYCTDLTKGSNIPVLHVNGDDPEAVADCLRIAARFRQKYARDIFVDMICYRRRGHNETDVPEWTQPIMYERIKAHPTLVQRYAERLIADGVLSKAEAQLMQQQYDNDIRKKFDAALADSNFIATDSVVEPPSYTNWIEMRTLRNTGIPTKQLLRLNARLTAIPANFKLHPARVEPVIKQRAAATADGKSIEWCHAESLAFAALAMEGVHVRLTGQDVERGTFTQRHAVLTDTNTGVKYCPLANIDPTQARVVISNSPLSEYGVLGFETGYSLENPKALIMWEAQFGDFANCAQVIFDQFISSMASKWFTKNSGIVVSLPHGFDGMGPEHSSCRLERFLQLSDDPRRPSSDHDLPDGDFAGGKGARGPHEESDRYQRNEYRISQSNLQVCQPTTPANYFHLLRRQIHRDFRTPLIVAFSKGRVRAPNVSSLVEMNEGTRFNATLPSPSLTLPSEGVRKVVVCGGQVEATLAAAIAHKRKEAKNDGLHRDLAVLTMEQIAPFPWDDAAMWAERFAACQEWVWLQEEPQNMGAWGFVRPRWEWALRNTACRKLTFVGRAAAASPAVGLSDTHKAEEAEMMEKVFA